MAALEAVPRAGAKAARAAGIVPMRAGSVVQEAEATYNVVLEPDEDGAVGAWCVELEGAISDGASEREALRNIAKAIRAYLESMGVRRTFNLVATYR